MKKHVEERINELNEQVEKYQEIITVINDDIESGDLIPSQNQKDTINYFCTQGRELLKEIDRLEKLMENIPDTEE